MKPYQHHDEVSDQDKATPKPKSPNSAPVIFRSRLCGVPEYKVNYVYAKHLDAKGNRETRTTLTRNSPRAVTLKRQTRGPASQAKARRN